MSAADVPRDGRGGARSSPRAPARGDDDEGAHRGSAVPREARSTRGRAARNPAIQQRLRPGDRCRRVQKRRHPGCSRRDSTGAIADAAASAPRRAPPALTTDRWNDQRAAFAPTDPRKTGSRARLRRVSSGARARDGAERRRAPGDEAQRRWRGRAWPSQRQPGGGARFPEGRRCAVAAQLRAPRCGPRSAGEVPRVARSGAASDLVALIAAATAGLRRERGGAARCVWDAGCDRPGSISSHAPEDHPGTSSPEPTIAGPSAHAEEPSASASYAPARVRPRTRGAATAAGRAATWSISAHAEELAAAASGDAGACGPSCARGGAQTAFPHPSTRLGPSPRAENPRG